MDLICIYELKVNGDYELLRTIPDLNYSYIDGFVSKDEQGIYQKFLQEEISSSSQVVKKMYPGQTEVGDKVNVDEIAEYVSSRYPDYQFEEQNIVLRNNFESKKQVDLSFFNQYPCDEGGNIESNYLVSTAEGNCSITAMTNLLMSWTQKGFIQGIDYDTKIDISESIKNHPQFEEWGSGKVLYNSNGNAIGEVHHDTEKITSNYPLKNSGFGNYNYYCWLVNLKIKLHYMNKLYVNLREYAYNKFGFTPVSGLYDYQALEALNNVPNIYYNCHVNVTSSNSATSAIDSINQGKAVYLGINGSSTYQDHAVVLLGYQKYSYTTGWWVFKKTHYAYFYEIADGWNLDNKKTTYFDPNTEANPVMSYLLLA